MPVPVWDPGPPSPDRATDTPSEFNVKAQAWADDIAYNWPARATQFGADLTASAAQANYSGSSSTSLTIGTGMKSFVIQDGKMFVSGQPVVIASAANPDTHWMHGLVSVYDTATGVIEVLVQAIGTGSGATRADWFIGLSGPVGPASGTVLTNPTLTGTVTEDVYTIADGASVDINPSNGSIQVWTLGANRTPTASAFASGQSVTLMIADGASYAVDWSSINPTWVGGVAPALPTSGYCVIEMWKVFATLYAAHVGDVA